MTQVLRHIQNDEIDLEIKRGNGLFSNLCKPVVCDLYPFPNEVLIQVSILHWMRKYL